VRYPLLLIAFLIATAPLRAQNFLENVFINADVGVANYDGELQPQRYTFHESHPGGGLGLGYEISPHFNISGAFLITRISGNDKYNTTPDDRGRNLNFTSNIYELNLRAEYVLFDLEDRLISPYVFGGVALFHFNPYTYDSTGKKVWLRSESTEGEGLAAYPNRKVYALTQIAIPFGFGIRMALSENVRVGLEVGIRKTFTGYLDDVHSTYVAFNTLYAAKGQEAVNLAWRSDQLPVHGNISYPADGAVRGNGKDDWYYFTGVRVSFRLFGARYTTQKHLGCPSVPL
jgi:hypothetical protein